MRMKRLNEGELLLMKNGNETAFVDEDSSLKNECVNDQQRLQRQWGRD